MLLTCVSYVRLRAHPLGLEVAYVARTGSNLCRFGMVSELSALCHSQMFNPIKNSRMTWQSHYYAVINYANHSNFYDLHSF